MKKSLWYECVFEDGVCEYICTMNFEIPRDVMIRFIYIHGKLISKKLVCAG